MTDHRLDLAEALLAKARSTSFEGERDCFVAGAYQQLGAFLDDGQPAAGRRGSGGRPAARPRRGVAVPALGPPAREEAPTEEGEASGGAVGEAEDGHGDAVLVVDLAAAERAYRGQSAWAARSGALIDLTI